jgi:hypothetical protein
MISLLFLLLSSPEASAVDVNPRWVQGAQPSGRTIFADFIGLPGRVILACNVPVSGALENCKVVSATPEGVGYERLALEGAATARMSPKLVGGKPTPTTVRFGMNFPVAEDFPPYTGPEPSEEAIALARPLAEQNLRKQGYARIVADVAADRQALVQSWIDELLPPDPEQEVRRFSLRFARTLTLEQLRNINAGKPPGGVLPDFRTFNGADYPDPKQIAAGKELRRRYCAKFDCTEPK